MFQDNYLQQCRETMETKSLRIAGSELCARVRGLASSRVDCPHRLTHPIGHRCRGAQLSPSLPLPLCLPSPASHLSKDLHGRLPEMLEAKPLTVINHDYVLYLLPHLQGTEEQKVTAGCSLSSGQMSIASCAHIATRSGQGSI